MTPGPGPDSLRAVLDSVFAAPRYRWVTRPDAMASIRHYWALIRQWFTTLDEKHPLGYQAVVGTFLLILVVIVVRAVWLFVRTVQATPSAGTPIADPANRRDEGWYRREADRLAGRGQFAAAMQADFVALVLALDARRALHFHPSKTPGEYAREWSVASTRDEFRELVGRLYGYAFARWPCGAQEYSEWRARTAPDRYAPAR
ncbi:MAG TPA: hypothetical protein VGL65_04700 [Gemmatimonadales bacterium]|jgi:hypothetical protein